MPKPYATFKRDDFPVIFIEFTGENANNENFQDYLDELDANYETKKPVGIVIDAAKAEFPQFQFQKKQANWMDANHDVLKNYCKGMAFVIPNAMLRNALKMIMGMTKNPAPYKVFPTMKKAKDWVNLQLKESTKEGK